MNKGWLVVSLVLLFWGSTWAQELEGTALNLYWDKGLRAQSADSHYSFKIGGRIMNDWAVFDEDGDTRTFFAVDGVTPGFGSGTEFRRARLYVAGQVYERFVFKAQYDFAGGDADFKDVYFGLKGVPGLGEVKIGHFKEAFSLEELTSSKYITFMERSLPIAFAPSRNTGIAFHNPILGNRATVAAGVFRDADDFGDGFGQQDNYNFTARVTGLPMYEEAGRRLLHVGLSYSHKTRDGMIRFRQRPEAHLSPVRFVDTGSFEANGVDLLSGEIAAVFGPLSIQAEYLPAFVSTAGSSDLTLQGYYVYGSLFLTGENRAYNDKRGVFSRVKPKHSFLDGKGGVGAVEAAVRYSALDLSDGALDGGELSNVTVGINWHLNPNFRTMLNYVFTNLDSVGETNSVQARFQIDF